jgi:hypothetical protein
MLPEIFNISKSGKRKGTDGEKSYGLGSIFVNVLWKHMMVQLKF